MPSFSFCVKIVRLTIKNFLEYLHILKKLSKTVTFFNEFYSKNILFKTCIIDLFTVKFWCFFACLSIFNFSFVVKLSSYMSSTNCCRKANQIPFFFSNYNILQTYVREKRIKIRICIKICNNYQIFNIDTPF